MRIDIPDDKRLVFETRFPIRWGDMDAMGHVNNAVYFRYMETVRIEWMTQAGMDPGRSSFDTFVTLERADRPGVVCAAGGATTVWVDFQAQKSLPLPDFARRLIAGD